ncbi:MAG: hypothetical protein AAGF12_29220 [Myxococcota bacterium]
MVAFLAHPRSPALVAGITLLFGCTTPTQVVVVLEADATVANDARRIQVRVSGPGGEVLNRSLELGPAGTVSFPFRIPVVPRGGDAGRAWALDAVLTDDAEAILGAQSATGRYVESALRYVTLRFSERCRSVSCPSGERCSEGLCVPACVALEVDPGIAARACEPPRPSRDAGPDAEDGAPSTDGVEVAGACLPGGPAGAELPIARLRLSAPGWVEVASRSEPTTVLGRLPSTGGELFSEGTYEGLTVPLAEMAGGRQSVVVRVRHEGRVDPAFESNETVFSRAGWYVSPGAVPNGSGSGTEVEPFSLEDVLQARTPVAAGDTVWLGGGTYVGPFVSVVEGSSEQPIVIRASPGEHPRLEHDGTSPVLTLGGAHLTLMDVEVTGASSSAAIAITGEAIRLLGVATHDAVEGVHVLPEASGTRIDGVVAYNHGPGEEVGTFRVENESDDDDFVELRGSLAFTDPDVAGPFDYGFGAPGGGRRVRMTGVLAVGLDVVFDPKDRFVASRDLSVSQSVLYQSKIQVGSQFPRLSERLTITDNLLLDTELSTYAVAGIELSGNVIETNTTYFMYRPVDGSLPDLGGIDELTARSNTYVGNREMRICVLESLMPTVWDHYDSMDQRGETGSSVVPSLDQPELRTFRVPDASGYGWIVASTARTEPLSADLSFLGLQSGEAYQIVHGLWPLTAANGWREHARGVFDGSPVTIDVADLQQVNALRSGGGTRNWTEDVVVFFVRPLPPC